MDAKDQASSMSTNSQPQVLSTTDDGVDGQASDNVTNINTSNAQSITIGVYKSIELADNRAEKDQQTQQTQPQHGPVNLHTQSQNSQTSEVMMSTQNTNEIAESRLDTFFQHEMKSKRNAVEGSQREVLHVDKLTIEGDSKIKILLFSVVALGFAITLNVDSGDLDFYQTTSIIMGGIFAQWIIAVLLALYNADSLCAIRIINTKIEGFGETTFPTQLFMLEDKPIESISEFAGVRGGTVHVSTLMMSTGISILFIVGLQNKKHEIYAKENIFYFWQLEISKILFFFLTIVCATGFLFVGYFEMNNHSRIHKIVHYLAVLFIAIGIIPFGMLVNWNRIFWIFGGIGTALFVLFVFIILVYGNGKKYPNNKRKVHIISLAHLLTEVAWSVCCAICTCVIIYRLNDLDKLK